MTEKWYSSKKIRNILAVGILRKANAFPDAECIGLRDRGDVVSPVVLRYKP